MPSFITDHLEEILAEWESFARTLAPASATMDSLALRDHAKPMLEAFARDIETSQTEAQQALKSKGQAPAAFPAVASAAAAHGVLRHAVGFDLTQLVAEFRALRASVLRLWVAKGGEGEGASAYEIERFNEAIDQALAESVATFSEELAKSRDTFLAILGHDLRSPLHALSSALQALAKPASGTLRAEALATGTRSVAAMDGMIRDLLEYTRRRLGRGIPISPGPANLEQVCKAAINDASLVYPATAFRFESEGSLAGVFDEARVRQVVTNLLNNAVEHGRRGVPVSLIVRGDEGSLSFEVRNEGVPIAPELLQVVFDPLVQIIPDGATAPRSTNLGLGLFIAREIVLGHGGTIDACSDDAATRFTVELPRAVRRISARRADPPVARMPGGHELRKADGRMREGRREAAE